MSWLSRIRAVASTLYSTLTEPSPELREAFIGGSRSITGRSVNPQSAMRQATVYACVRVLSQSMATLPLTLYEAKGNQVQPAVNHPLYPLLKYSPNSEMTSVEMIERLMSNLCLRGTSYDLIGLRGGRPVSITPLVTDWMTLRRDENGELRYDYHPASGEVITFEPGEIWRNIGLSTNGLQGLTPIQCAREAIGLALAAEEQGSRMFANGLQTPIVAMTPDKLTPEAANRFEDKISRRFSGLENAWKIPLLQEGLKFERIGMTAADAEFVDIRKMQTEEIARFFGVPLHLLASLDRSTNNNIEHQGIDFVTHTLMPYIRRIEATISRDLLLPSERGRFYAKFNVAALLRGDQKSRYEAYASAVGGPWMYPNEARAFEEFDPIEDGNKLYPPPNTAGKPKETESGVGKP